MYLWQIRHFPNHPQTLLKLTLCAFASIVFVVSHFPKENYVAAQTSETTTEKKSTTQNASLATEFLDKVRQELPNHQSIKAELHQVVAMGDQQFKIAGMYQSMGQKLRLEYSVVPDQGVQGKILEVCDGKDLWTQTELPDGKRVTHRNVQQLLAAAAASDKRNLSAPAISVELGLGGLTSLLASLERTMSFDAIKEEEIDGHRRTIIQGRWKKELAKRWPKDKDDLYPPFVPDLVRLYVNSTTMFPEKLLYLKKQPQKKSYQSMLSLEFRNVEFDQPIEDNAFVFEIPAGIIPEEVTKQFLDRLTTDPANPGTK